MFDHSEHSGPLGGATALVGPPVSTDDRLVHLNLPGKLVVVLSHQFVSDLVEQAPSTRTPTRRIALLMAQIAGQLLIHGTLTGQNTRKSDETGYREPHTFKDGPARPGRNNLPQIMSGDDIGRVIRRISHEILESHRGARNLVLIGIHTRGVVLARMLAETIASFEDEKVPVGELDIGLYRDDRDLRPIPERQTDIPTPIDGKHVIIVDDVLYTGRTVRAALDALSDIGRAMTTELAVLVDRGHRELPIRADYVGKNLPTSHEQKVRVRVAETDGIEGVYIERAEVA